MSAKNKELVEKINKAFSKGNTELVSVHLADNIRWNIVGMPTISGKNNFLNTMKMMAIESFPDIVIKNIIAEGNYVVVESMGNDKTGGSYNTSYCDVYYFKNKKIHELTTYIVDITLNE